MPPKKTAANTKAKANAKTKTAAPDVEDETVSPPKKVKKNISKKNEEIEEKELKVTAKNKASKTRKNTTKEIEEPVQTKVKRIVKKKEKEEEVDEEINEKENEVKSSDKPKRKIVKGGKKKAVVDEPITAESEVKPKRTTRKNVEVEPDTVQPTTSDETEEKKTKKAPKAKGTAKNTTSTNWDEIDFTCDTKNSNGKAPNYQITSWNVDGLRAWVKKGGLEILENDDAQIICLQETKCSEEKLPNEVTELEGYEQFWCIGEKEGYAGVGVISKIKPISVEYGIGSEEQDNEGRCITAEFDGFYLVNVYVPNAGRKLVTLPKRLEWNTLFKKYIKSLDDVKPVIICGDLNVAHSEVDLANPKTNTKNAGFTAEEREGLTDFLDDGYIDTYRKLYPDKENAYTFWTYMSNARSKNVGWRLDYFLVSERFFDNICDNVIHSDVFGSDHCPSTLYFNL